MIYCTLYDDGAMQNKNPEVLWSDETEKLEWLSQNGVFETAS